LNSTDKLLGWRCGLVVRAGLLCSAVFLATRGAAGDIEIVVRTRDLATSAFGSQRSETAPQPTRLAVRRRLADGILPPASPPGRAGAAAGARRPTADPFDLDPDRVWLLAAPDSAAAESALRALATHPDVVWAERNLVREPALEHLEPIPPFRAPATGGFPDDPLFVAGLQWGLENRGAASPAGGLAGADIAARAAWRRSTGSATVKLAVADTGIDPGHPEFRTVAGYGRIESPINVTDDPDTAWRDTYGHGTPVTGVMAATTGDGARLDTLGVAGVCGGDGGTNPGCAIVPVKITRGDGGGATSFDIARGILHAVRAGARAVNLSFAGSGPSRLEREALHHAIVRGCAVVAAAGNRGASAPRAPQYPAAYAADGLCIQAGASDAWDRRAAFSSYGPGLDVLAPGAGVWTTYMTYPSAAGSSYGGYVAGSGTSFAAPFVTGVVGLLAAARPELGDTDFQRLLQAGARDLGAVGPDETTGWGRLDADATLALVGPGTGVWHDEVAASEWIERDRDTLAVGEDGPGDLAAGVFAGALRIESRATVAVPDSFLPGWRVWPRVGGTMCVRGDFQLPHFAPAAALVARSPRSFTLAGWSYRIDRDDGPRHVPLPPDQARFGFTVIGPVARPAAAPAPAAAVPPLVVAPNPFRGSTRVHAPPGARVEVFDAAGRRVRRLAADGSVGPRRWDGADDAGRPVPQGLYVVRARWAGGETRSRVVRIE
jgi:subtilisin family serine protease